jgi:hypothetical protein
MEHKFWLILIHLWYISWFNACFHKQKLVLYYYSPCMYACMHACMHAKQQTLIVVHFLVSTAAYSFFGARGKIPSWEFLGAPFHSLKFSFGSPLKPGTRDKLPPPPPPPPPLELGGPAGESVIVSTMKVFDDENPIRKLIPKIIDLFVFVVVLSGNK